MKLTPVFGKIWIKPDSAYEKGDDGYWKKDKHSKIVIPTEAALKKDKTFQIGTIMAACPTAGLCEATGEHRATFNVGDKVVYIGAHVSTLNYNDEVYHLIPGGFCWAIIEK